MTPEDMVRVDMVSEDGGDRTDELEPAVLHVDMDAFFAAVERLDNPELIGKPVVVGGTGDRGVVASCTYEARVFGVRSAMPVVRARRLCPHAIFLNGRHSRYAEVSRSLHEIFLNTTPLVESIGLDEAFLDVSGSRRLMGSPLRMANRIRAEVRSELDLDCSVGVGRSKLISKLASRAAKPRLGPSGVEPGDGVKVVLPGEEQAFLLPLPVRALWGVGPATAKRLHALGVRTVAELLDLPDGALVRHFGELQGRNLGELATGHDVRPVLAGQPAKSVGHEETFRRDIYERDSLRHHVLRMSGAVAAALAREGLAGRTVTLKVRFDDFETITRSHSLPFAVDSASAVDSVAGALLDCVDLRTGVRLLGVSVSSIQAGTTTKQLAFDVGLADAGGQSEEVDRPGLSPTQVTEGVRALSDELAVAVASIRERYGRGALEPASMLGAKGMSLSSQKQAPWGPSEGPD